MNDETVTILEFLEARSRAAVAAFSDRGRHLLRDAAERLAEALQLSKKIAREHDPTAEAPAAAQSDDLLRLAYLCLEVDRKVDDAAHELAAFDAALVGFAVGPFQLGTLADVVDRLERYVEDYVAEATERARALYRTAGKLLRPTFSAVLVRSREHAERRLRDDPLVAGSGSAAAIRDVRVVVGELVPFFAALTRYSSACTGLRGT